MHTISTTTNLLDLARRIARELRRGSVVVDGEFQRLKRLYIELIELIPASERRRLHNLAVPLKPSSADVRARLGRRITRAEGSDSVPLEDLLLMSDFAPSGRIADRLFPDRRNLASGIAVDFNDRRGLLSLGQYRAILSVLDRIPHDSPAAQFGYTVERHHDHVTFHHPVQIHAGIARATIDAAQLEQRDDFAAALLDEIEKSVANSPSVALDEDFVSYDRSCVWNFNRAFWRFLRVWETVTGKSYQRALPKGKAESNHQEFIEAAAGRFAGHVRELEREGAISAGEELWIFEKAPGSGGFIAGILDYLRERHPEYYPRMRVVLSDISADVLSIAAGELKRRGHLPPQTGGPRIFFWPLGGGRGPELAGGELIDEPPKGRFLYIRHANFFDQLPTRLFARISGRHYELYVQAVIDPERLGKIEQRYGLRLSDLQAVIGETTDLTALDSDLQARFIHFWSEVWLAVKFNESYCPIGHLAGVHPDGAEIERIFGGLDDLRFVTSDIAIATMRRDLELLHPEHGYACFTDVILQRAAEFKERWIELAKYDNGVWVGTNGVLMAHLLGREDHQCAYYPVELTLGAPSAVYTMTLSRPQSEPFTVTPELIQELTGIAADEVNEIRLAGLPRRVRNNLRDLPALLEEVEPDIEWSRRTFDDSLDLTRLMRELYYHSPPSAGENSLFLKMAALVGEVLDQNRGRRVRVEVDLTLNDLRALEDFLDHRPISALPMELVRPGASDGEVFELRLRLPTIAQKLKHGEFLMLAEVELPRANSLEQLRRRILQFQAHVDAVSLTSGRMADPRFLRSRETLALPLLKMVHPDQIVITLEMSDRQGLDFEREVHAAERQGVHNIFVVTGDFERDASWRLDSLHGIQLADRMRNGEGADGRALERRSRVIIAGALTWGAIPDVESRIDRDVLLKTRAGADLLFTQPVYDLRLAKRMLDQIAARGLDREITIVAEILPLLTLETVRSLDQTPGIAIPSEMVAACEQIDRNVAEFCRELDEQKLDQERGDELFASRIFANVSDIPGYDGFFSPARARAMYKPLIRAIADGRKKASRGREFEEGRRAARRSALTETGFAFAEQAIAALARHQAISGFLFVARNGRDLRRLTKMAARERDAAQRATMAPVMRRGAELARGYGGELVEIADRLAPFGLALPDGTPTDLRLPAVMRSENANGLSVLIKFELESDERRSGKIPPEIEALADAIHMTGGSKDLDLRVLCVPAGWERNSHLLRANLRKADCEIRINLPSRVQSTCRMNVHVGREPLSVRVARHLEHHPLLYSLATLGEFWIKHPLFGQVLCGGPCGISGAWQFTCTMGKTFTSKRQIEKNLLDRPIFSIARGEAARSRWRRTLWTTWETVVCAMLWPPIILRKAIVAIAARIPARWFLHAHGPVERISTRLFNHLECPKSLRNGACGAPSKEGLCGELMKYGVIKPCVFCYRNARDRWGEKRAAELIDCSRRWRAKYPRWLAGPIAAMLEIRAAFAARRRLSNRIYPRIDTAAHGASAIVSAMTRRFKGAVIFGDPALLPSALAHPEIALEAHSELSRRMLPEVRRRVKAAPPLFENRGRILATMLETMASETSRLKPTSNAGRDAESTYERMFISQLKSPQHRAPRAH